MVALDHREVIYEPQACVATTNTDHGDIPVDPYTLDATLLPTVLSNQTLSLFDEAVEVLPEKFALIMAYTGLSHMLTASRP